MIWHRIHPRADIGMMGIIPDFLHEEDPRPAKEQFAESYIGGWSPFPGFTMLPNGDLSYPGDPPTRLMFQTTLRDEIIRIYEHAWVVIMQKDSSFEVCRLD